eukprot:TRINITY_DN419_c0_g3_i1.p1 TRINITY_DN419_c0_g3~~TRINITY_DN419_c0_g3_i1.p1  ORF type:complete len:1300 (-),score=327.77 TRINITY_DN419_c0_g3_i1:476-4375(-)
MNVPTFSYFDSHQDSDDFFGSLSASAAVQPPFPVATTAPAASVAQKPQVISAGGTSAEVTGPAQTGPFSPLSTADLLGPTRKTPAVSPLPFFAAPDSGHGDEAASFFDSLSQQAPVVTRASSYEPLASNRELSPAGMLHSQSMPSLTQLDAPTNGHLSVERHVLTRSMPLDGAAGKVRFAGDADSIPFADNSQVDSAASFFQTLSISAAPQQRASYPYAQPAAPAPHAFAEPAVQHQYANVLAASAPPQYGRPVAPSSGDGHDFFAALSQSSAHYQHPAPTSHPAAHQPSHAATYHAAPASHPAAHQPFPPQDATGYHAQPFAGKSRHQQLREARDIPQQHQQLHHSQPTMPTMPLPYGHGHTAQPAHSYAPFAPPAEPTHARRASYGGAQAQPFGSASHVPLSMASADPFGQHGAAPSGQYVPHVPAPSTHEAAVAPPSGPFGDAPAHPYATQYGAPVPAPGPHAAPGYGAPGLGPTFGYDQHRQQPPQQPQRHWASISYPSPYADSAAQAQANVASVTSPPDSRGAYVPPGTQPPGPSWATQSYPSFGGASGLSQSMPAQPVPSAYDAPGWNNVQSGQHRELHRRPHAIGVFGLNGRLVTMFPRRRMKLNQIGSVPTPDESSDLRPGHVRITSLDRVLAETDYMRQLVSFPGPLAVSGSQDKATKFVTERATAARSGGDARSASMANLYGRLRLLIANYGRLSGTENKAGVKAVADLLLQSSGGAAGLSSPLQTPGASREGDAQVVGEVQRLLLSGQVEEAHKFAISNHLWSHAMLLASSISADAFKQTVRQFAESAFVDGSPMRSMYLLFSGNPKEVFQPGPGSDGVGILRHWQENLAAVLSNGQPGSPATKGIIGTMGDRLWAHQGVVEAAHFCYMIAEHEFSYFDNPNARLVLLGADHKRSKRTFVSPDAIQRTEVVEYATALSNPQFFIPQIQVYKMIYAYQLAEVGLLDAARKYHQAIQALVTQNKSTFAATNPLFVQQLTQLGERLSTMGQQVQSSGGWSLPRLRIGGILSALVGSSDEVSASSPAGPASARTPSPAPAPVMVQSSSEPSPSPSRVSPRPSTSTDSEPSDEPKPKAAAPKKEKEKKTRTASTSKLAGALSAAGRFFQNRTNQADLGEENAFEYNAELKRWVKKGEKIDLAAIAAESKPPPPPPDAAPPGPPGSGGNQWGASADSTPQRRRAKYVDTLNPNAGGLGSSAPSAPGPASSGPQSAIPPHMAAHGAGSAGGFHRASSAPNFQVFTPAANVFTPAPGPDDVPGYGSYQPPQPDPVEEQQPTTHKKAQSVDFFSLHD